MPLQSYSIKCVYKTPFRKFGHKCSLIYIFVTSNQFKTVLLESGECMVRQGCVFRGVLLLVEARLVRRLVRKHNLDEPYAHLSLVSQF